ncbi:TRAP transporter permease [Corynebacterium kozikiae]|uniref:TRAP transporter permease n=1 Tax=Corynebacterium kozikiae TaxID=2968469 RepID=UPI00211CFD7A|nr:TRAP transporter permease [Corynebacterium sp. 76QC2CO]
MTTATSNGAQGQASGEQLPGGLDRNALIDKAESIDFEHNDSVWENPRLTKFWGIVVGILSAAGILLTINQVFYLGVGGVHIPTNAFLYIIMALFIPIAFIVVPFRKEESPRPSVPWYDVVMIVVFFATNMWLAFNAENISLFGWSMIAPTRATVVAIIVWALILEALRRAAGWIVALLAALVSLYPLIAESIPSPVLSGIQYDFGTLAQVHVMGADSIVGLPMQTAGQLLIGFMAFGVVLQHTGGARFFNDLAMSIFGKYRGGTAKVSVASSAALGMMSGSAVSNVLTTGPMTIPAMIKNGFSRKTAGAVEATASSGGSITPPIMGAAAFLMVSFAGVPYTQILIAASIPAFLYFFGIYMQLDGYSAKNRLRGVPKEMLPVFGKTLVGGWPFILALGLLTVLLVVSPSEAQIPYWVVLTLLIIAFVRKKDRMTLKDLYSMHIDLAVSMGKLFATVAGVGLILGGLSATGVALSMSSDLIAMVGDNVILLLITGALACFVLGMGLTISAAYVFLAIIMAPALLELGVNVYAAHLFIIYWASVSYITPPVGLAAFAAAGIAKSRPMETSVEAMRLGAVKYIVPFGFALNPALVAQASFPVVLAAAVLSIIGVFALAAGFSGFLQIADAKIDPVTRIILVVAGFAVFLPQWSISIAGAVVIAGLIVLHRLRRGSRKGSEGSDVTSTPVPAAVAAP